MTFEEIIQALIARDERVTSCFFFGDGPTLEHIEEVRRGNPTRALKMRRPICHTCRPALLKVLHRLYGGNTFNYEEHVSEFYLYLMTGDKLKSIKKPDALMGWIVRTAYYFFLHEKIRKDSVLENVDTDSLSIIRVDVEDDESPKEIRAFVKRVLDNMPHREYAMILDEVTLEVGQYKGKEKSEKMRVIAKRLSIPIDNLYVKVSLAKKQFKETAKKISLE